MDDVERVEVVQLSSDPTEGDLRLERKCIDDVAELVETIEDVGQGPRAELERDIEVFVVCLIVKALHDARVGPGGLEGVHIAGDEGDEVEDSTFDGDGAALERTPEHHGTTRFPRCLSAYI